MMAFNRMTYVWYDYCTLFSSRLKGMKNRRLDTKKSRDHRLIEQQYGQYFSPFPGGLIHPEGSLVQPSPYLNIWSVQASSSGEEPTIVDSMTDESESNAKLE